MAAHLPPGCNATVRELGFSAEPYSMPRDTLPNRVAGQVGGCARAPAVAGPGQAGRSAGAATHTADALAYSMPLPRPLAPARCWSA